MSRIRLTSILLLVPLIAPVSAWAGDCKHRRDIDLDLALNTATVRSAKLDTSAGDKKIHGVDGSSRARITGRACASSEELLAGTQLTAELRGDTLYVETVHPNSDGHFSWGNRYAYVDFELEIPSALALDISDRSGDVEIRGVRGGLQVQDNSGDLDLRDTAGELHLSDRSGDIDIRQHRGLLVIDSDRSGDIRIEDVEGSVQIEEDRSGDILVRQVSESVTVGSDNSGDIEVADIAGDFSVHEDGSGDVEYERVAGRVEIPKRKR